MSVDLDEISDVLLPRRYQEEIFLRARESNVIAALDTGSGKTYISTLLMKSVAAHESSRDKIIVFLVPKVALVVQQGEFIAKQTSLRVRQYSGMSARDMGDRDGWRKEIEESDVFVMTAQIFLNLMTHSHCKIDKVSMLVFDECHHARKNHAYNGIMREYFLSPPNIRPKVFGMTASPIWNPKNAEESLATLERNLDAKVIAVKQHVDELLDHAPRPDEIIHAYPVSPNAYPAYPARSLLAQLALHTLPTQIDLQVDKIKTRYDVTFYSLGPYGAEWFLYTEVKLRVAQLIQQAIESAIDTLTAEQYRQVIGGASLGDVARVHPRLRDLERILAKHKSFFEDPDDGSAPFPIDLSWCTPKVHAIVDILVKRHTSTFQGIVFVEQRHVAACLAVMLPRIPSLAGIIKCGQLVGHGSGLSTKASRTGMDIRVQQDTVKLFRERQLNLLVATSVAEEGLDFPACDLVIRFDPVQHMVGYLQSRGRARHKTSTFIIMVQEGSQIQTERYRKFLESEPELKKVYQDRDVAMQTPEENEEEDEADDPDDLLERERYVVPSTGAVLSYSSATALLNNLCSLIPRDKFTSMHMPKFVGDHVATVYLPSSLPLPPERLVYVGPPRRSKKEAKRAAAFLAVKSLHQLNVFDDYLLPAKSNHSRDNEDPDGVPLTSVKTLPDMLDVRVRDPWVINTTLWLHVVCLDGIPSAGLVTGTRLPPVDLVANNVFISTEDAREIILDPRSAWSQRRAMDDYTRMGLWWCITGRGITLPLTCYLVPITCDYKVDFEAIDLAVANPRGSDNWNDIGEEMYGRLLYVNTKEFGHPLILHRLRPDVTAASRPPEGSRESLFPTYREYWQKKYTRKGHTPHISPDGTCVEGIPVSRNADCRYSLTNDSVQRTSEHLDNVIYPLEFCRWALMPERVYNTFFLLPSLCHRITDVYRAREIRTSLGLPAITDDLLIQALTIPSANAGFNNQRLETFGDAVLKLCAVVHLFNKYPHRHEGQLDSMKRVAVANRTLLSRAIERHVEQHITRETQSLRLWRYVVSSEDDLFSLRPRRRASRQLARRSLQDCMEAILGASFVTGGIDMALCAGTALGLSIGGPSPWRVRYSHLLRESPLSPLFLELQETLGYDFRNGRLLLEAVTHPSFGSTDSTSYQRLEFLGDAVIDLVITEYLYKKFPRADSGQLSWARSRAVCSSALASVAVKKLGLHKLLLVNSLDLNIFIGKYVPILEDLSPEDVVVNGWKQDPPKALSDVLESIVGAIFVDANFNYDKVAPIVEFIMGDLLPYLRPDMPKDPVSNFMIWIAKSGCRSVCFSKSQSRPELRRWDCMSVLVHGQVVVGPHPESNLSMAKGMAAENARAVLSDPDSPYHLSKICVCQNDAKGTLNEQTAQEPEVEPVKEELDDETDEGFATLALILLDETEEPQVTDVEEDPEPDDYEVDREEEKEVERMMELMDMEGE